jgi:hypothetical protein
MKIAVQRSTFCGILSLLLLALASCGGTPATTGGDNGTGIGPVLGFGSVSGSVTVIVNGVKYNVDNTVFVDAHGRALDNLAVGMWVKVTGSSIDDNPTSPTGTARRIEVLRLADGPMDDNSVSFDNNSFRVMGQTVFVGLTTVFDNVADLSAIDNLARQGKRPELEIHGTTDDTGFLRAGYVRLWADNMVSGRGVQLKGTVRNLDRTGKTFAIGPLLQKVDYNRVTSVPAGLDNGVYLEVKGTYRSSDNAILAGSIRLEVPASGQNTGDLVKAEGYVNAVFVDPGLTKSFELIAPDGLQVVNWSTATTSFRDGSAPDVVPGARVQVEGSRNQDNTVAAKRISLRKPCKIRIESTVTGKTSSTITLLGRTVTVNLLTSYKDSTGAFPGAFGIGDIRVGNTVRVDAFLDAGTALAKIVATRVEFLDPDPVPLTRHLLLGTVDSKSLPFFTIQGVQIQTFSDIRTSYLQVDGTEFPPGRLQPFSQQLNFFDNIAAGSTIVKARGTYSASFMDANEVQIQPLMDK